MFIAAQFTIAQYWKQPKCPSANEWIQKLWYMYTTEFYTAERKKELIPFAMAEGFYFDEVPFVYSFLYVPCFRACVCDDVAAWNV